MVAALDILFPQVPVTTTVYEPDIVVKALATLYELPVAAGILFVMSSWLRKMQHNDKLHTTEIVGEN